ncbi:DUF1194 domain-containing protein [Defluviimonas sp. D31]|uniref:DUF1194 domain-containing protein n=1 Tax=Defluviimonas sp. D31 TaxID=3083253 RepID=UPI00296FDEFF|nr:DUF1194 domain-containing protein [Defluviimonas sp. D31]MDW4550500.1 DUF1194 domain-containing protein [Defluviimonas sp. D31]
MRAAVLFALAALAALAAAPAEAGCRLALVLALDVSASVDMIEDGLQRQGLARVLRLPEIEAAFLAFPGRPVALAAFEWSGRYQQDMLLDWRLIETPGDLAAAATAIGTSERGRNDMPTALGYALGFASGLFREGPECDSRKIDVSGDGRNNEGFPPDNAYDAFPFEQITVNGLAIGGSDREMANYYRRDLIRGPGAFVIEANDFADFERAMRLKLLRELEGPVIGMAGSGAP